MKGPEVPPPLTLPCSFSSEAHACHRCGREAGTRLCLPSKSHRHALAPQRPSALRSPVAALNAEGICASAALQHMVHGTAHVPLLNGIAELRPPRAANVSRFRHVLLAHYQGRRRSPAAPDEGARALPWPHPRPDAMPPAPLRLAPPGTTSSLPFGSYVIFMFFPSGLPMSPPLLASPSSHHI